jgi:LysM repeat protein
MTNQSNQPNRRPPMPTLNSDSAKTQQHQGPMAQPTRPSDRVNTDFNMDTQRIRPTRQPDPFTMATQPVKAVAPKLPAQSKANPAAKSAAAPNKASRHTVRVALATGTTIAVLLGTQALAIFGRTVDANPVIVGASGDASSSGDVTQVADVPTDVPTDVPSDTPIATNTAQPSATSTATATLTKTTVPTKTAAKTNTPHPTTIKYTIVSSDTLGEIALKFNTTVNAIVALNSATVSNINFLKVGQVLLVPGPMSTDPLSPTPSPTITLTPSTTLTPSLTPTPSVTPLATNTSIPKPTSTPKPIATAKPYVAPIVQPAPVTRSSRR